MEDLRNVKEEETIQQQEPSTYTGYVPTIKRRLFGFLLVYKTLILKWCFIIGMCFYVANYPTEIGNFLGSWYHNFTTAIIEKVK